VWGVYSTILGSTLPTAPLHLQLCGGVCIQSIACGLSQLFLM